MTRILHPTKFYVSGILVCPDDGWTRWQSGRCPHCDARLIGPRKRPWYIDVAVRTWLIDRDGAAWLWDRLANELVPFADAPGPWPP